MAGLLYKILLIAVCALAFCCGANAYESSFPFPFEFGHSSDIYLNVQKKETKETRRQSQAALDLLKEKGIKNTQEDFVKYIKKNEIGAIKLLLEAGFDPNANINANYPIYYAAKYKRPQIIALLLEYGANPNRDLTSPLHYTILAKDYESTKLLLEFGADPNYLDIVTDETLLYCAAKKKNAPIFQLLLKNGAKMDFKTGRYIKKKHLEKKLGTILD